jgi:hypothetical protein
MAELEKDKKLLIRKTSVSKFYRVWVNMKSRCNNPNIYNYHRYGGRGINVCKKWETFDGFIEDMFESYVETDRKGGNGLYIERIDNDKGYSKANCKWATMKEQANNTSQSKRYSWHGKKKTLAEWADYLGIKPSTLRQRFYTYKWDLEKCLTYKKKKVGRT